MNITQEATQTVAAKAATAAQYGGSGAAVYFGLTANEIGAFGGLLIGLIGLLINVIFKWKHLQIAKKRLEDGDE